MKSTKILSEPSSIEKISELKKISKSSAKVLAEAAKNKNLAFSLIVSGLSMASIAQQQPGRDIHTYVVNQTNNFWTPNAAAQPEFDTEAKRTAWLYKEGLVAKASNRVHFDLEYRVPKATSQVSDLISKIGDLPADRPINRMSTAIANGLFPVVKNGSHNVARYYDPANPLKGGARGAATMYGDVNIRISDNNMEKSDPETVVHEDYHTYANALPGSHNNTASVPVTEFDLTFGTTNTNSRGTVGNSGGNLLPYSTASAATNPYSTLNGGPGVIEWHEENDLDFLFQINTDDLDIGGDNNVANRKVAAINSGNTGYQSQLVEADPNIEAPKMDIEVIDGKYTLINSSAYENLGFPYDEAGNKIPARLTFWAYLEGSTGNDQNINPEAFSLEDMKAGIPDASLDNPDGLKIQFRCFSFDPNSLGAPSDPDGVLSLGIEDHPDKGFKMYPNPTNGIINIDITKPIEAVKIFDFTGKEVFVQNNGNKKIDVSRLSDGIYYILVKTERGVSRKKLIIGKDKRTGYINNSGSLNLNKLKENSNSFIGKIGPKIDATIRDYLPQPKQYHHILKR